MELHIVYMDQQLSHSEGKKLIQKEKKRNRTFRSGNRQVLACIHVLIRQEVLLPGYWNRFHGRQTVLNVVYEVITKTFLPYYLKTITDPLINKHFGIKESLPDLARTASLILINTSPIFQNVRPTVLFCGCCSH